MKLVRTGLAALVVVAAVSSVAVADPLEGVSFTTPGGFGWVPMVAGYEFVPNTSISVVALGFFDDGGDGFVTATHDVGLWATASQTLLASTVVTNADPLAAGSFFRYHPIAPLALSAGTSYIVAGNTNGNSEALTLNVANLTVNPNIAFIGMRRSDPDVPPGTLPFPGITGPWNNVFGGNFMVPEPTSLLLMGLGGLGLLRRRR